MKKMMFILMIMTAFLASTTFAAAPVDVTNPSFEDSTVDPGVEADFWVRWSGGGATESVYVEGDPANANTGDDYFIVGNGGSGWAGIHTELGEEVDISGYAGGQAEMIFFAKTADGTAATGSVAFKFEFYATQGEGWADGPFAEEYVDTGASYQQYNLVADIPAGMNYARATVVSTGTAVHVDDVWVGEPGTFTGGPTPTSPDPGNGSVQSVKNAPAYGYEPVTDLSWTNPDPADDSTVGGAANLGVEVNWLDPTDPNIVLASKSVAKGSGNAFETVALADLTPSVGTLADDSDYAWRVIITDANSTVDPIETKGNLWTFQTGDAEPNFLAPADQYMWLDQDDSDGDPEIRTFSVTATYSDDGKSAFAEEPNFVTGNHLWDPPDETGVRLVTNTHTADTPDASGAVSGTVTAVYETVKVGGDGSNPTAETAIPGFWNFGLQIIDATDRVNTGPTGYYYVGENCGQAAAEGGDTAFEESLGAKDVNDDCVINLVDFADLLALWLEVSPKKE